jgi:hypothetical protein
MDRISRRRFLATGALAAGSVALAPGMLRDALAAPATSGPSPYGPLGPPDANSLMLPAGFTSRRIARRLEPVPGTAYTFPIFPDGQATYPTRDGGWILVTNSESPSVAGGGASGIRFAPGGETSDAFRVLGGTNINCAGGPTPWGTWLSCEETPRGMVWECDPAGVIAAEPRPALGLFNHEAAAVDPSGRRLYLTEDETDGGFYRFTPTAYPGLDLGLLEVAVVDASGQVSWRAVPDPLAAGPTATRHQVPEMTRFAGGEGIWYDNGFLYFTTKGDKRVWAYEPAQGRLQIIFDRAQAGDSALDAVDNVTVSSAGEIFVCEDGGNMEIGLITPERSVSPFLRFVGPEHDGSEVCGAAFDPSGTRLYFTSQRAFPASPPIGPIPAAAGAVFEVRGPFRRGIAGPLNFPAGELRPNGPLNAGDDRRPPRLAVSVPKRVRRRPILRRGLPVSVRASEASSVSLLLTTANLSKKRDKVGLDRPRTIRLSRIRATGLEAGRARRFRMRFGRRARGRLRRRRKPLAARLIVTAVDRAGNRRSVVRTVRVGRAGRAGARAPRAN